MDKVTINKRSFVKYLYYSFEKYLNPMNLIVLLFFSTNTGKFFCVDGSRYEGTFKDNKANGYGTLFLLKSILFLRFY